MAHLHRVPIDMKLSLFRTYLESMEGLIEREMEKFRQRIGDLQAEVRQSHQEIDEFEARTESQTEEERRVEFDRGLDAYENSWIDGFYSSASTKDDYYDTPYWDLEIANAHLTWQWEELETTLYFPNILRRSLFAYLYSFLEETLVRECRNLEQKSDQVLRLVDIAGRGASRALTYLMGVHGVRLSLEGNPKWTAIQDYQTLRDCIVHDWGRLGKRAESRERLDHIVNRNEGLSVCGDEVILSADFCSEAIDTVEGFLVSVLRAIRDP